MGTAGLGPSIDMCSEANPFVDSDSKVLVLFYGTGLSKTMISSSSGNVVFLMFIIYQ